MIAGLPNMRARPRVRQCDTWEHVRRAGRSPGTAGTTSAMIGERVLGGCAI